MSLESYITARRIIKRSNIKGIKLPKRTNEGKLSHFDLSFSVGYWWKSQQIHDYFMAEINQPDDCREYEIDVDTLQELLAKCENDQFTMDVDVNRDTIEQLKNILDMPDLNEYSFTYRGSW